MVLRTGNSGRKRNGLPSSRKGGRFRHHASDECASHDGEGKSIGHIIETTLEERSQVNYGPGKCQKRQAHDSKPTLVSKQLES